MFSNIVQEERFLLSKEFDPLTILIVMMMRLGAL